VQGLDPDKTAIASGRDLRIKPKTSREICNTLKGMKLEEAKTFEARHPTGNSCRDTMPEDSLRRQPERY